MLSLIIGIGIMIGTIIYMLNLSGATSDAISTIVNTVSTLMIQVFQWFVLLTPLIVVIAPLWMLKDRDLRDMLFGGLYGIVILFVLNYVGLFNAIYGYFLGSGMNASILGSLYSFAVNIYYAVIYLVGVVWAKIDKLVFKKLHGKKEGFKKLLRRRGRR